MGYWSAEIFDDDGACDIIDEYSILLRYGLSVQEAYTKIQEYFYEDYKGTSYEDVYWFSVALFQWENGILMEEVKQNALACINDFRYMERWEKAGQKMFEERKKVIGDLRYKIENVKSNEQKVIRKKTNKLCSKTKWKVGDILLYKMNAPMLPWNEIGEELRCKLHHAQKILTENYLLFQVVDVNVNPVSTICPDLDYSSDAIVMLYDWIGKEKPTVEDIKELKYKKIINNYWSNPKKVVSSICIEQDSLKEEQWGCFEYMFGQEDFTTPQLYIQHNDSPMRFTSQLVLDMIFTFVMEENDVVEWYTDKHFFNK